MGSIPPISSNTGGGYSDEDPIQQLDALAAQIPNMTDGNLNIRIDFPHLCEQLQSFLDTYKDVIHKKLVDNGYDADYALAQFQTDLDLAKDVPWGTPAFDISMSGVTSALSQLDQMVHHKA